jgi:hypothetical protein
MTPQELQDLLDELEASRASRKRAWENLQEIRWIMRDTVGIELPPPARKTIDLEGRIVKDGSRGAPGSPTHSDRTGPRNRRIPDDCANRRCGEEAD